MTTTTSGLNRLFQDLKARRRELTDDLPIFCEDDIVDTEGVWSWDEKYMIVGTCVDDLEITPRRDLAHLIP